MKEIQKKSQKKILLCLKKMEKLDNVTKENINSPSESGMTLNLLILILRSQSKMFNIIFLRFMDTSFLDVNLNPKWISVRIKGKLT